MLEGKLSNGTKEGDELIQDFLKIQRPWNDSIQKTKSLKDEYHK